MQTTTLSSSVRYGQLLNSKSSTLSRIGRFLSERYAQRERPNVVAESLLFGLIVLISSWPMVTLVQVMSLHH
jgi:hypothetical protein